VGEVAGYELVARALKNEGADTMFFIMGGPMLDAQNTCRKLGIRMIDVRHEQAAAMMANAYARVSGKAGVCSAASGPAAINLITGLAHAYTDSAPVIALGGASPISQFHWEAFQEIDQLYDAPGVQVGRAGDHRQAYSRIHQYRLSPGPHWPSRAGIPRFAR
jgi:thiamine pyrophosphate-dependent acetolactate synthase large subunit-like protein